MTSHCHRRVLTPLNHKLLSLWLATVCLALILDVRAQLNASTASDGIEAPLNMITTEELPSTDLSTGPPAPPSQAGQCGLDGQPVNEVDEDGLIEIKVGYLASSSSDSIKRFAMRIGGAMTEAVNAVNDDKNLLPGYKMKYVWTNTGHTERESIRALTEQWKSGVVAFFGPNPTCSIEAKIVSAWELPMLSATCAEAKLSDKSIYPTFARTIPTDDLLTEAVTVLLEHFNWYNVSIVSSSESNRKSVSKSLSEKLPTKNIYISDVNIYESPYIPPEFWPEGVEPEMRTIVRETYEHTRIYIFCGELWEVYELLNEMMFFGLLENGEYMVIWANQENYDDKQIHLFQGDPYKRRPSTQVMMYYRTLLALFLSPATDPSYENFKRKAYQKIGEPPFNFDFGEEVNALGIPIEAAYLYDNVYNVYAPALNETLAEGYDIRNGTEILRRILCRKHASITGRPKYIDARGDAYADITVIAMKLGEDVDEEFGYSMHPVATIKITNSTPAVERSCLGNGTSFQWVYEPINGTFIPWISGNVPLAVPVCGFYGELCVTPYRPIVEIVSGVVGGLLLIILIVAIAVYRNWKYEQELASLLWKIDYADIQTKRHNGSTISAISKLSLMTTDSKNSVDPYRCQIFTEVGTYKNMLVAIKKIHKRHVDLTRSVRKELKIMRDLRHPHLNQFIGACVDPPNICTITEYCPKGSLQDILENDEVKLDSMFIASLIGDILKGLSCLHASETHSHGNLKSSNCVVDSRWVLRITDFGLHQFRSGSNTPEIGEHAKYEKLLWRAPELLRCPAPRPEGTQKGDMYSLGIILYEMATRQGPYGKCVLGPKEIIDKVTHPLDPNTPFRPNVMEVEDCPSCMLTGMQECWQENPDERPDVKALTTRLKPLQKGMKPNILDNMIVIMEKYANNLEDIVEDRTHQLIEEKKKTDNLLHQMLPKPVANQLKRGMQVVPESFECVTIFFSDIVGFTSLSSESTPFEVVDMLNDLYTLFDEIISYYDVYKVETIGDAYMLVSGLPLRNENKHAAEIASTSLHLLDAVKAFKVRHRPEVNLKLRIGIHSGPTVAGVVGLTMPRYCLFGDTVNTSSRMESNGEALKIHTSSETKNLLEQIGGFVVEERGLISMKGKGQLVTYWLMSADRSYRRSAPFRTAEENATVGLFDSPHGNHANRHSKINAQSQKEPFAKRLEVDGRPTNPNVCRDVSKTYPDQTGVERQRPHSMFAPGSHGGTPNHFPNSTLIDFSQLNNSNENSPKVTDRLLGHLDRHDSGEAKLDLSSCTNSLLDKRQRLNDSALDYSSRNSNSQIKEGLLENEVETVV